jgi:hypothetical protein
MNWAIKHRKRKLHLELKERKIKDEKKMKSSLNKIQLIKVNRVILTKSLFPNS